MMDFAEFVRREAASFVPYITLQGDFNAWDDEVMELTPEQQAYIDNYDPSQDDDDSDMVDEVDAWWERQGDDEEACHD